MTTYRFYAFYGDCALLDWDYRAFDEKYGTIRLDKEPVKLIAEAAFSSVAGARGHLDHLGVDSPHPQIFAVLESPILCFGFCSVGALKGMSFVNFPAGGWQRAEKNELFKVLYGHTQTKRGAGTGRIYFGTCSIAEASGLDEEHFEDFYRHHSHGLANACTDVMATTAVFGTLTEGRSIRLRLPQNDQLISVSPALNSAISALRSDGVLPNPTPIDVFKR